VTPYLPSPPRFGGQRRLHGLVSALAEYDEVSVLSFFDPASDPAEDIEATRCHCRRVVTVENPYLAVGGVAKRLRQAQALLSTESYEQRAHHHRTLDRTLRALVAEAGYDVVQFEFAYMASLASTHACAGAAVVLDEHNIEYDVGRQTAETGELSRRLHHTLNWRKLRAEEQRIWREVDGCALTSARDEYVLHAHAPGTRTAVVPNAVDLDYFRPSEHPVPEPFTMLFFGAVDYYPNTDGLLFFLDEILPRVRVRLPAARLYVVGRRPPDVIASRDGRGVTIVGAVDDVRPYIERAAVVVVPLRLGGGTRLKVLEAMAMGRAVVSTSLGAQGLEVAPERDLFIADDAESFATRVVEVLEDPALANRLGALARQRIEAHYGWAASVKTLRRLHGEILEAKSLDARLHA
jgi:glycosyltransferase involved in cell wall biosynthesis